MLARYKFSLLYLLAVLVVMVGFNNYPLLIPIPFSEETFSFWAIVVGAWFILRDFAQREIGHKVLFLMSLVVLLGLYFASPGYVIASVGAMFLSEILDYLIFTLQRGSFAQRVIRSSVAASFVDTLAFFYLADIFLPEKGFLLFTPATIIAETIAKITAIAIWYYWLGGKERAGGR